MRKMQGDEESLGQQDGDRGIQSHGTVHGVALLGQVLMLLLFFMLLWHTFLLRSGRLFLVLPIAPLTCSKGYGHV